MFRGTNYVTGAQLDAEDAYKSELGIQKLKNKGLLNVADRRQTGETDRTEMSQEGQTGRTKLEQAGMTGRLGQQLGASKDAERRKALQERLKFYTTPEYNKDGTLLLKAPLDQENALKMAYGDVDMMYGNQGADDQGVDNKRQDTIRSFRDAKGIRNWTNQPGGTLTQVGANKEALINLSGMPTTLKSARVNQESVLNQRPTFEEKYGNKPLTLENIWAKNEELKRQRDAKRKSQWTVPY